MKIEANDIEIVLNLRYTRLILKLEELQKKLENNTSIFIKYKDLESLFDDFFKYFEVKEYQFNNRFLLVEFNVSHEDGDKAIKSFINTFNSVMSNLSK